MNRKAKLLSMVTVALAPLAAAQPAYAAAQEEPSANGAAEAAPEPGVGDIVVTARKRLERSNDVGMSISALTGDSLIERGITTPEQLVKVVPGFSYSRSTYGSPVYTLRGIGFNESSLAVAPAVSAYVDEVPLPFSVMTQAATLDLERVEVLKGPQGTLFGQNSTGGAINYIAAKPTRSLAAGFDITVARFDEVATNAFVSGPLSDTLRARVAVRKQYMGPWQKSVSRPGDENGNIDRVQARLLLDWEPDERTFFELHVSGWRDNSEPPAGQFVGIIAAVAPAYIKALPQAPEKPRAADWTPGTDFYVNDDFWQISLRGSYDLTDDMTLTSISAYQKFTRDTVVDADGTQFQNWDVHNYGFVKSFSQELRLAGEAGPLEWLIGGNYQNDKTYDVDAVMVRDSSFPFDAGSAIGANKVETWAGFANVDWHVTPDVTLSGGARYTWQDRRYVGCLQDSGAGDLARVLGGLSTRLSGSPTVIPPGSCVTLLSPSLKPGEYRDTLTEDNLSWRVGVNWKLDQDKLLYANVSRGYKNGVFVTTGATFAAQLFPATQESVLAYEAGFKVSLLDRTMQLNGAAFYYDYTDKQIRGRVVDPVIGLLYKILNVPESRIAGGEIQLVWEPVEGLSFNGGATYIDSKIKNFTNYSPLGNLKPMSGDPYPLTPKWQLNADLQYDFPIAADWNLFVGGNVAYQDSTNAALGLEPILHIKSYTVLDARLGVHDSADRLRLSFFVNNLTNEYYYNNVVATSPDVAIRYTGMPRTYGLTASYRFR
jgi:outer membrane receptor protein involved in Fe transport